MNDYTVGIAIQIEEVGFHTLNFTLLLSNLFLCIVLGSG